jgi:hypothetical protein
VLRFALLVPQRPSSLATHGRAVLHKLKTKESPFLAPPRYHDSALRKMPFFLRGGIFFDAALWRFYRGFIAVRIKPRKSRWRLCRAVYLRRFYFKFSCSAVVVTCTPSCTPSAGHWATGRRHGASVKRKAPSSSRKDALGLSTGPFSVAAPIAVASKAGMRAVGSAGPGAGSAGRGPRRILLEAGRRGGATRGQPAGHIEAPPRTATSLLPSRNGRGEDQNNLV